MAAAWARSFSHRLSMLAVAAQGVTDVKEHPTHTILADFAARLDTLAMTLQEMQGELEVHAINSIKPQQRDMEAEVTEVEQLVVAYKGQCQLSLLLSCPFLLLKLQSCRSSLSKDLSLITPEMCTPALKVEVMQTRMRLDDGTPKLGVKEKAVIDSLGVIKDVSTPSKKRELAEQIAECLSVALESSAFAEQLLEVKRERQKVEISQDDSFTSYLDQCILVLEGGLASQKQPVTVNNEMSSLPQSPQSWQGKGLTAPSSPLPSFICPITKQVMRDPVQIASGQTYEREAIDKWFKDGNSTCPLGERLKNTKMKSNFALRQSIAEWRERNYHIRLDNAEWHLRSIHPIEQARGARDIKDLCEEDQLNKYAVASRKMIPLLIQLSDSTPPNHLEQVCFGALETLAQDHHENQEIMVKEGVIDVLVRSLRNYDGAEPAISLLKVLSINPDIAKEIGRTQDAVLLLVTFLGHENEALVLSVKAVLLNLPTTDENVVIMAKANLMKPLVTRLIEGDTDSKILMARTLERLVHMPDTSKRAASTRDSIFTLTNMMNSAKKEEVDSAIAAVKNLSGVTSVCSLIAECSGLEVLIRLLTSKKTSDSTKSGASYIIANILLALGNEWPQSADMDTDLDEYIETFLIVISSGVTLLPVQSYLLQGLLALAQGKDTSRLAKVKMMDRNVFSALIPLFRAQPEVRRCAVKLFSCLSSTYGDEACGSVKIHLGTLSHLVEMLRGEETSDGEKEKEKEKEKVSVAKIIAHLPMEDSAITVTLDGFDTVPILVGYLYSKDQAIQEASAGALVRFTSPNNLNLQMKVAKMEVIPKLVSLLDTGRPKMKLSAAKALANFSRSSPKLVEPVAPTRWWQCFRPNLDVCRLHGGLCSAETTFCLLEAEAIQPLLAIVEEDNRRLAEAALSALYTLFDCDYWERACHVIRQADGIPKIISKLPNGSPLLQELAVMMCEKFFRIPEYQAKYGVSAQMHFITLAQQGAPKTKDVAGRILRQLDLLHTQSHYFGYSSTSR